MKLSTARLDSAPFAWPNTVLAAAYLDVRLKSPSDWEPEPQALEAESALVHFPALLRVARVAALSDIKGERFASPVSLRPVDLNREFPRWRWFE